MTSPKTKTFWVDNQTNDDLFLSYFGPRNISYCYSCATTHGEPYGGPYKLDRQYKTSVTIKYDQSTFLTIAKVGTWNPKAADVVMHFDDIDSMDPAQQIENNGTVIIRAPFTPSTPSAQPPLPIFVWVLIIVGSNIGTLFLTWMLVKLLSER